MSSARTACGWGTNQLGATAVTVAAVAVASSDGVLNVIDRGVDATTVAMVASLVSLFFMLFSGYLLNKTEISPGLAWITNSSSFAAAFEIMMVNELEAMPFLFNPPNYVPLNMTATVILQTFDMDPSHVPGDYYKLLWMLVIYLASGYVFLWACVRERS